MIRTALLLPALVLLVVPSAPAGEIPEATLILEATVGVPATMPSGAPPRFVLRRDGSFFLGGSARIYSGLLGNEELKAFERRVRDLRKSDVLAPAVSFGEDTTKRFRLRLLKDGVREVVITGDPATAPPHLQGLARFVIDLLRFDHPSMRPWAPAAYAVAAREGILVGGCREWLLPLPFDEVLTAPRRLAAEEMERWPSGADPASVCHYGRRYVVTLRPLLPGEQP